MGYTVLARKYRPQKFADLVGQEHVTRTLANALGSGRVAHAFLFTGARGVGKTSTARLLAKALNCTTGPTAEPCNECGACLEITQGTDLDVLEIDGASNNSVEDVRRLQEGLPFRPARDRFKVVIVDEVHMLSTGAFNAFLKTLEEPPPHVKFIFATTEVHKVPITIRSRCQRHDFRLIPQSVVAARVQEILTTEEVTADDSAVQLVAREAGGSMRDALTLLDQLLAFSGNELKLEAVSQGLGIAGRAQIHAAATALLEGDPRTCLRAVHALGEQGLDVLHFSRQLLQFLRDLVVLRVVGPNGELVDLTPDELEVADGLAKGHESAELERAFAGLSELVDRVALSGNPRLTLEMGLVRLADRPRLRPLSELVSKLDALLPNGGKGGGGGNGGSSGGSGPGGPGGSSGPGRTGRAGGASRGSGGSVRRGSPAPTQTSGVAERSVQLASMAENTPVADYQASRRASHASAPQADSPSASTTTTGALPAGNTALADALVSNAVLAEAPADKADTPEADTRETDTRETDSVEASTIRKADQASATPQAPAAEEASPTPQDDALPIDPMSLDDEQPPPWDDAPPRFMSLIPAAKGGAAGAASNGSARNNPDPQPKRPQSNGRDDRFPIPKYTQDKRFPIPTSAKDDGDFRPPPPPEEPPPPPPRRATERSEATRKRITAMLASVQNRARNPVEDEAEPTDSPAPKAQPNEPPPDPEVLRAQLPAQWEQLVANVKEAQPALGAILEHGITTELSAQRIAIRFPEGSFFGKQAQSTLARKLIEESAQQLLDAKPELSIECGRVEGVTLAQVEEATRLAKERQARHAALTHPLVLQALEIFPEARGRENVHIALETT